MEVLSNGMISKFWIPVEEEPDIDRFIDESIIVEMEKFKLVGTLKKVSTCKKKDKETKEYEYFKELTVAVTHICSADDENFNIVIPDNKDEYGIHIDFRYVPVDETPPEEADETEAAGPGPEEELDFEPDAEQQAELDHREEQELADDLADEAEFEKENNLGAPEEEEFFPPEDEADAHAAHDAQPENDDGTDGTDPDEFFDEPTEVDNGTGEEKKETPDDDGIDWGDD